MGLGEIVRTDILQNIRTRRYVPGKRIDAVRVIAKRTKVSTFTVSRIIQELVQEGVLRTRKGSGCYVVEDQDSKPRPDPTIGILSPISFNKVGTLMAEYVSPLQAKLMQSGRNILFMDGVPHTSPEDPFLEPDAIAKQALIGLVVFGIYDLPYLRRIKKLNLPMVAVDLDASTEGLDSVCLDQMATAALMVRKLHENGARRIAFLGGPYSNIHPKTGLANFDPCAVERRDGWRVGCLTQGLEPSADLLWETEHRTRAAVLMEVRSRLKQTPLPDALLTEFPGHPIKATLSEAGPKGRRIKLAGWIPDGGDVIECAVYARCDIPRMGEVAAELLLKRLDDPGRKVQLVRIGSDICEGGKKDRRGM